MPSVTGRRKRSSVIGKKNNPNTIVEENKIMDKTLPQELIDLIEENVPYEEYKNAVRNFFEENWKELHKLLKTN